MNIATIGFEKSNPPRAANMLFCRGADGSLEHWIDGTLRAVIPPEGWEAYAQEWPDCAPLVDNLKG